MLIDHRRNQKQVWDTLNSQRPHRALGRVSTMEQPRWDWAQMPGAVVGGRDAGSVVDDLRPFTSAAVRDLLARMGDACHDVYEIQGPGFSCQEVLPALAVSAEKQRRRIRVHDTSGLRGSGTSVRSVTEWLDHLPYLRVRSSENAELSGMPARVLDLETVADQWSGKLSSSLPVFVPATGLGGAAVASAAEGSDIDAWIVTGPNGLVGVVWATAQADPLATH
jgi:hypothetical protein